MRIIFRKLGLLKQCKFVANGQQVTECYSTMISESNYNTKDIIIILIDFEMPILSGLEAIKVI
jgi:CheY-like chemotaxis protein